MRCKKHVKRTTGLYFKKKNVTGKHQSCRLMSIEVSIMFHYASVYDQNSRKLIGCHERMAVQWQLNGNSYRSLHTYDLYMHVFVYIYLSDPSTKDIGLCVWT